MRHLQSDPHRLGLACTAPMAGPEAILEAAKGERRLSKTTVPVGQAQTRALYEAHRDETNSRGQQTESACTPTLAKQRKTVPLRKHSRGACSTLSLWQSKRLKETICPSAVASPGNCKHCRYDAEVKDDKAPKHGLAKQRKSPRRAPKMKGRR